MGSIVESMEEEDEFRDENAGRRRSFCLTAAASCVISSPSCFPVQDQPEYSRISNDNNSSNCRKRVSRKYWRNLLRKFVREGKSFSSCSKAPVSFKYDAVSYSLNFDEGSPTLPPNLFPHCVTSSS